MTLQLIENVKWPWTKRNHEISIILKDAVHTWWETEGWDKGGRGGGKLQSIHL